MKTIIMAASLFAASFLLPEITHAAQTVTTNVPNREFNCTEDPELGPICGCPESTISKCVITVTFYGPYDIEVTIGSELGTPGTPINPSPLNGNNAEEVAAEVATMIENGMMFSYEP